MPLLAMTMVGARWVFVIKPVTVSTIDVFRRLRFVDHLHSGPFFLNGPFFLTENLKLDSSSSSASPSSMGVSAPIHSPSKNSEKAFPEHYKNVRLILEHLSISGTGDTRQSRKVRTVKRDL